MSFTRLIVLLLILSYTSAEKSKRILLNDPHIYDNLQNKVAALEQELMALKSKYFFLGDPIRSFPGAHKYKDFESLFFFLNTIHYHRSSNGSIENISKSSHLKLW